MSPSTCDGAPQRLGAGRRCGSPVKINACCGCRWVSRTDSECSRKKRTSFTRRPIFTRRNTNAHSRGTIPNSRSTGSWTANRLYRQGTSGAWRFPTPKPSNKFPMRVTIFGASGLLGKALVREWSGDTVTAPSSPDADIRDSSRVRQIVRETRPEWIVLSAAYTDVDGCESNAELAFAVNRDGAMNVATAAKEVGARLLFLSSDYVFDGRKTTPYEADDPRNPQSAYGQTKAEAEIRLLDLLPHCCVARTSWLFGVGGKCFPDTILRLAASRPTLDVVDDQRGCPTYSVDLSRAIIGLCRNHARGIVHMTNAADCSWFEFAREILRSAGLATTVRPVSSQQMARPAPRPAYSVLSPTRLQALGIEMPSWHDALQRYLEQRQGPTT